MMVVVVSLQAEQEALKKREEEEKADPMKALEHRTVDSRIEMDMQDAIEEIFSNRGKREAIKPEDLLAMRAKEDESHGTELDEQDDALVKSVFKHKMVRRLSDSDEEDGGNGSASTTLMGGQALKSLEPTRTEKKPLIKVKLKKRKIEQPPGNTSTNGSQGAAKAAAETETPKVPPKAASRNTSSTAPTNGGKDSKAAAAPPGNNNGGGLSALVGYGSGSDSD